jgi:hypothetical protein
MVLWVETGLAGFLVMLCSPGRLWDTNAVLSK